jgi:hypothetical protein
MQKVRIETGVNYGRLLDIFVDEVFLVCYSIPSKTFSFSSESDLIELDTLKEIINELEKKIKLLPL